jgi:hypothetical protein
MSKAAPAPKPLVISWFCSGFYTYRSQLFAPFKSIGVNIIAFHDSVLDGADMELTDLLEWQQRPGFSRYCTQKLNTGEVINQFYSARTLNGTLLTMFDSNQRLASFTPTSITTMIPKGTTAQGYVNQVGNTTYFYDGYEAQRYDQTYGLAPNGILTPTFPLTISATGGWLPSTAYTAGSVLLDYNGCIQYSGLSNGTSGQLLPVWSTLAGSTTADGTTLRWENLGTVGVWYPNAVYTIPSVILDSNNNLQMIKSSTPVLAWSSSTAYVQGNIVLYNGTYWTAQIANTGVTPNGMVTSSTVSGGTTTYVYTWFETGSPISAGATEPVWATNIGGTTVDGLITWQMIGPGNIVASSGYSWGECIRTMDGHLSTMSQPTTNTGPLLGGSLITPSQISQFQISSNTVLFTGNQTFAPGEQVYIQGMTTGTYLNGQTLTVQTSTPPAVVEGTAPPSMGTFPFPIASLTAATAMGFTGILVTLSTPDPNIAIGQSVTIAGNSVWSGTGYVDTVSSSTQFGISLVGSYSGTASGGTATLPAPVGGFTVAVTSNILTVTMTNTFQPGNQLVLNGFSTATWLNGHTITVATSSSTQFTAPFTHANYTAATDTGNFTVISQFTASSPSFTHANVGLTNDVGTVTPVLGIFSGHGILDSRCSGSCDIAEVFVYGTQVVLTTSPQNFFPGNSILISSCTNATFLNGMTLQIAEATSTSLTCYLTIPGVTSYGPTIDFGIATFCAIEIYRTADGGGVWYLAGAVPNPGQYNPWSFVDIYSDGDLNQQMVAPLSHQNDPPPGEGSIATPSVVPTLCAYWQGRQWVAAQQYLYFDAGADCQNGDPHQSWPPANRFEYSSTITALAALGNTLLVFLADKVCCVRGGPQTLSFYPDTIMTNFGVSSANCLFQDGQELYVLSTQGQIYSMSEGAKQNEGLRIADYIANNFPTPSSYVTYHRNGNDVGLYLCNGTTQMLRFGPNVGGWSVPYYPVGGCTALNSVETSIGTYSLLTTNSSGYILARNLSSWQDDGGTYTNPTNPNTVYVNIGSITVSQAGEPLVPVQHIIGYFDTADGAQPSISILPNEIADTGLGWIAIPPDAIIPEPPYGALPSTTLQQLRYPINMCNSVTSQFMHHLQIKIAFPSTNSPHTIKTLCIKFDQE